MAELEVDTVDAEDADSRRQQHTLTVLYEYGVFLRHDQLRVPYRTMFGWLASYQGGGGTSTIANWYEYEYMIRNPDHSTPDIVRYEYGSAIGPVRSVFTRTSSSPLNVKAEV
eukprot:scaffold50481_cov22-Prasinocladus_malaysianus.AAC.1